MPSLFPETGVVWGDEEDLSGADSEEVRFGRSWRFDYDAGDFVLTPSGKVAAADAHEAWVQWCIKAVKTPTLQTCDLFSKLWFGAGGSGGAG